jgi:allophanate hydrolase
LSSIGFAQQSLSPLDNDLRSGEVAIAVVGAHLSSMALNGELRALDGRLLQTTTTAQDYRLYALRGTAPAKPGLLRVEAGLGAAIEVEVWALATAAFGAFVANVPPPMSIGTVRLADGSAVKGFLVEPQATVGARDISQYGGWRAFLAEAKQAAG